MAPSALYGVIMVGQHPSGNAVAIVPLTPSTRKLLKYMIDV